MADEKSAETGDSDSQLSKSTLHSFQLCAQDGTAFHVNPHFLAEFSPVFEKLFFGDFEEAREKKAVLQDETPQSIKTLLGVLGAKIEDADADKEVTIDNIDDLLRLASKFDIEKVYATCRAFIQTKLCAAATKIDDMLPLLVAVIEHPIPGYDFMWEIADHIAKKFSIYEVLKTKLWKKIHDCGLIAGLVYTCMINASQTNHAYKASSVYGF